MSENIKSEDVVLSAPLSFIGSAQRIIKITHVDNVFLKWLLLMPIAILIIIYAWVFILFWYLLFGVWLVPYRLVRRSQRKSKRNRLRHQEIIESDSNQLQ